MVFPAQLVLSSWNSTVSSRHGTSISRYSGPKEFSLTVFSCHGVSSLWHFKFLMLSAYGFPTQCFLSSGCSQDIISQHGIQRTLFSHHCVLGSWCPHFTVFLAHGVPSSRCPHLMVSPAYSVPSSQYPQLTVFLADGGPRSCYSKFMMAPGHTYCHRGTGLHCDIGGKSVQGNCVPVHILLENVVSNLHFFVIRRVNEPHEQPLDVYINYFDVFERTKI